MAQVNVVDSSGWLEVLAGGANAAFFQPALRQSARLFVPSICVAEVVRRLHQQGGATAASAGSDAMRSGTIVPLDERHAIAAAAVGLQHRLAIVDSIVYATAQGLGATLWTQDADFKGLPGVQYRALK